MRLHQIGLLDVQRGKSMGNKEEKIKEMGIQAEGKGWEKEREKDKERERKEREMGEKNYNKLKVKIMKIEDVIRENKETNKHYNPQYN